MFRPSLALFAAALTGLATFGCVTPPSKGDKKPDLSNTVLWTLSSPDFAGSGIIPDEFTCNGQEFGSGRNPELAWNDGPDGTQSYALVLKDISITEQMPDAATMSSAYYWALWDIPAETRQIAHDLSHEEKPPELAPAQQWSEYQLGFVPPCPNSDPSLPASSRAAHHFAFTLYALPVEKQEQKLERQNPNYTQTLDAYLKKTALGAVDLIFTTNAASDSPPPDVSTSEPPSNIGEAGAGPTGPESGAAGAGGAPGQ